LLGRWSERIKYIMLSRRESWNFMKLK
jgi:hypothetical protein